MSGAEGGVVDGVPPVRAGFDPVLRGEVPRLVRDDGRALSLDHARWLARADGDDEWLLRRCRGPVIDLGCGPGRLTAALHTRGVPALGVDSSPVARDLCRRRGVAMVCADLFGGLPSEGTWRHVLLADGNIGIGGDPTRLLTRSAALVHPSGSVLVEVDPDPAVCWRRPGCGRSGGPASRRAGGRSSNSPGPSRAVPRSGAQIDTAVRHASWGSPSIGSTTANPSPRS
ncbi:hypothetical protein Ae168Ps1_0385 [Pseudonocardia sp. Ae168_Ps1]|uniref:methyltransferase domain-containing protein n=1 Tax=unclassified Pseudonocardia TaxID=2619320 RepID=UPI00094B36B1|nr:MULTISPECIES: methyltransferase domain-containing protein [unclassified Pseudonocardia]OLL72012.1 hypothetical protein Ae150APs1_0390 [Pseudonocardia sp. Ae150A_Ps1]OLL77979.1 hypothetical protein Ae168Ps1_0385 [Pseudonocardia sp. Ae168_Ps1]OLL87898.1 hypothetical protein Ae263Ps1_4953c [Pseudonocardia sp. Ae263_Ps1]OLL92077.1 hypothetical protein Ae356Ps1_1974 [Pseudonocardia sp. Ae356_Ps1]